MSKHSSDPSSDPSDSVVVVVGEVVVGVGGPTVVVVGVGGPRVVVVGGPTVVGGTPDQGIITKEYPGVPGVSKNQNL